MKIELLKVNSQPLVFRNLTSVFCILSSVLTNKPNVKYAKMNIYSFMTGIYEIMDIWLLGKTNPIKAKTNPKQTQLEQSASPERSRRIIKFILECRSRGANSRKAKK